MRTGSKTSSYIQIVYFKIKLLKNIMIISGVMTYLLLNATDLKVPGKITTLDFLDLFGEVKMQIPIPYNEDHPFLYNVSSFSSPDDYFYIKVGACSCCCTGPPMVR